MSKLQLNAKSDSCMKLSFHNDLTMDITSLIIGQECNSVEDSLMTVVLGLGLRGNFEFTREQVEKFVAKWLNDRTQASRLCVCSL